MKSIWCLILTLICFVSCKEKATEVTTTEITRDTVEYGKSNFQSPKEEVEIVVSHFDVYDSLYWHLDDLTCNGFYPWLKIESTSTVKKVYPINLCFLMDNVTIYRNDVIEVYTDSVYKSGMAFPLDSLESVMRRDYENQGVDPLWSRDPDKVLLYVKLDDDELSQLLGQLDFVTTTYDNINVSESLNIELSFDFREQKRNWTEKEKTHTTTKPKAN